MIENSANCKFWNNEFELSGFGVSGESGEQLGTLEISVNNTANGKPIHYLKNLRDAQLDGIEAGQVIIANCSGLRISNVTVEDITNSWEPWYTAGLECLWNENLTLDNLTLRGNARGALVNHCPNIHIVGCNFTSNFGIGANVQSSPSTNVTGCYFSGGGIAISESSDSIIRDCVMTECGLSLRRSNDSLVIGVTQSWSDGNGIGLGDSDNVTVSNCTMAFNGVTYYFGYGLDLYSLTNSTIANNSFLDNCAGIEMSLCTGTRLIGNEIRGSHWNGIDVRYSSQCLIDHNRVIGSTVAGLDLADFSDNINVTWNVFEGNNYGIYYQLLHLTTVHHNDFAGNMANAYTHVSQPDNTWDDGYPSGGNYWDDYSGADYSSGPAQDIPGSDGIGDVPYEVRGGGLTPYVDRYPFMNPLMISRNSPPVAAFNITPSVGNITTEFTLDASSSYDAEDPTSDLEVRWDIGYDGTWEIDWSKEKVVNWKFTTPGNIAVRLEVRDTRMYLADASSTVNVTDEPPTARFIVTPEIGNSSTSFSFDASSSWDLETSVGALEVRWDWENDGTWDTAWSTSKTITHSFSADGTHKVALEVMDSADLSGTTTRQVIVDSIVPVAVAGADYSVDVGASVTLDGSGSTDNMAIVNYTWSCKVDGEVREAYGVSSVWSFNQSGVYEVVLIVEDVAGNSASDIVKITVKSEGTGGGTLGDYWWVMAVLAIVIVSGVAILLLRRRK
jgi:parallel beta-helix repeat protein